MSTWYSNFTTPVDIEAIHRLEEKTPILWKQFKDTWVGKFNPYIPDKSLTTSVADFLHFLLKYRYTDNWKFELQENYLPISIEQLQGLFLKNNYATLLSEEDRYKINYQEIQSYQWLHNQVLEDFGIDLTITSHVKLIFQRKSSEVPNNEWFDKMDILLKKKGDI